MSHKQRCPAAIARNVADQLVAELTPRCERIETAGSLRRGKADVGDIEILFVPRIGQVRVPDKLFTLCGSLADELLEKWLARGVITKRFNINGSAAWGTLNKLAVHVSSGIPLDLFATTARALVRLFGRTHWLKRDEHDAGWQCASARDAAPRLWSTRKHKDRRADHSAIGARSI